MNLLPALSNLRAAAMLRRKELCLDKGLLCLAPTEFSSLPFTLVKCMSKHLEDEVQPWYFFPAYQRHRE